MNTGKLTRIRACDVTGHPVVVKGLSEKRVRNSVLRILRESVLCSISTVSKNNHAHINTAYFCNSNKLEIYFLSHPVSLHCQNLAANPSAAIAIFSSAQRWTNPGRGLQFFGICNNVSGRNSAKVERLYGKRFPAYAGWKAALGKTDLAQEYCLFRFVTRSLKLHDEVTFGDGVFVVANVL